MKNLKNLGIALTRAEQKTINGGKTQCMISACVGFCDTHGNCIEEPCVTNFIEYHPTIPDLPVGFTPCDSSIHSNCCA